MKLKLKHRNLAPPFITLSKALPAVARSAHSMATSVSDPASRKRLRENDVKSPPFKFRRTSKSTSDSEDRTYETGSMRPAVKHTKKERKQNPSSRVHSLRKLLARGNLPSNVQQEKERELAALLHDQERTKTKKEAKKTLGKYHYVRFVERQKAEKRIRKLQKQLDLNDEKDEDLKRKIHEMEVNRNYAIYSPLDQKYVSVFVDNQQADHNMSPSKPATWYLIEETMRRGKSDLEALRDGKVRLKPFPNEASESKQRPQPSPRSTNYKAQDGSKNEGRSDCLTSQRRKGMEEIQSLGEELSDEDATSDGGFFEK